MRILLLDNSPSMGGSIHQLASQARALTARGATLRIVASNPPLFDGLVGSETEVVTLPWSGFRNVFAGTGALQTPLLPGVFNKPFSWMAYRRLYDAVVPDFLERVAEFEPDVVHLNNLNLPNKVFGDCLVRLGQPFTLAAQMIRLFARSEGAFAASAGRLTCVSKAVRESLRPCAPQLRDERVAIIPNGLDLASYDVTRDSAVRAELGVPQDAPMVLSLGRLTEWKGHDVLVRAMARLPEAWLVQAGGEQTAAWRERVQALAKEVGVADRFVIAGVRSDVPRLLAASDVLAHSSKYSDPRDGVVEAFGRVIVEGMAAGLPVIATDAGGAAEILRRDDGSAWTHEGAAPGVLVKPGDAEAMAAAIGRYVNDARAARRAGEAGRIRARDFDENTLAARFGELLETAAAERPPRPS